ncbi:MAG: aegerolysin family protein [Leptospiraceae bacterium]|nr:aegerolysin family protein [Leptospiraceae bacterium]
MAYAQWISINIKPKGFNAIIRNVKSDWGKFYQGSKDNEVNIDAINNHIINDGEGFDISSCGREEATSGTEGSFDIYDGSTHIGNYYWDCPWGSKTNTSTWTPSNDNYLAQVSGANLDSGALGDIAIKIGKY